MFELPYCTHDYELFAELFTFDNATFYRAKSLKFNGDQMFIIKVIDVAFDVDAKSRFSNEVYTLCKLDHPNIARIYNYFQSDTFLFIVFENFKTTLADDQLLTMIKNRMSLEKSVYMQIFNGIQYCHQKRICHRNLCLSSIVIDENNRIKIINFDYSALINDFSQNDLIPGEIEFTSPEILMKIAKKPTLANDIWSLGVLLYYLNVGRSPWPMTHNEAEKISCVKAGKVLIPQESDSLISFIVHKMLVVNPEQRLAIEPAMRFFESYSPPNDQRKRSNIMNVLNLVSCNNNVVNKIDGNYNVISKSNTYINDNASENLGVDRKDYHLQHVQSQTQQLNPPLQQGGRNLVSTGSKSNNNSFADFPFLYGNDRLTFSATESVLKGENGAGGIGTTTTFGAAGGNLSDVNRRISSSSYDSAAPTARAKTIMRKGKTSSSRFTGRSKLPHVFKPVGSKLRSSCAMPTRMAKVAQQV